MVRIDRALVSEDLQALIVAAEPARFSAKHREIYFVQGVATGLVKIGVATDAMKRIRALQCFSPDRLHLLGLIRVSDFGAFEAELHRTFAPHWSHGEWFSPAPELLAYIGSHADSASKRVRLIRHEMELPPKKGRRNNRVSRLHAAKRRAI